jgi:transposase-like protein
MDHAQELPAGAGGGDPEVPEKAKRRQFDSAYKLRILEEADRSTELGQLGELLRREGLYSSHLTIWRRQRDEGSLAGLTPKRRGRKGKRKDPLAKENEKLHRENRRLTERLRQAHPISSGRQKEGRYSLSSIVKRSRPSEPHLA